MNEKFTDTPRDEDIARKLDQVAEQTHANPQFAAQLEEQLRRMGPQKPGWFAATFQQVSPALRWVALMLLLGLVLSWSIRTLVPTPQPATENTPALTSTETSTPAPVDGTTTPVAGLGGYDFRGAKLFLQEPLPASPATAHVYLLNRDGVTTPATQEQARALADRFGIQGEMYTTMGLIYEVDNYMISDGKQSLQVHSDEHFSYTADLAKSRRPYPKPDNPDAEATIREFLAARGFNFPMQVFASEFFNAYIVQPLAPDSIPMQYESFAPLMRIVLDDNGQVLTLDASLMDYDPAPLGEYGIITAEEALQRLLDDQLVTGKMESVHGPSNLPKEWYRTYPDNQTVTTYGYLASHPSADPGKPPLVLLDGVPLTGNISGLESQEPFTFLEVTGQYLVENGIRKLQVESWDRNINQAYLEGTLTRQGDQVLFVSDDGSGVQYPLIDPPADLPVDAVSPENNLSVTGVIVNNTFAWYYIQFFENNMGGGGGGGGGFGFHQLNLSGTPVPFALPTAPSIPEQFLGLYEVQEGDTLGSIGERFGISVADLIRINDLSNDGLIFVGQQLSVPVPEPTEEDIVDLRGYLSISIHNKNDGSSTKEYGLEAQHEAGGSRLYTMEGSILSELDPYNGLPILVTGTLNTSGKLVVESYKIPYPGLQFQILRGTQSVEQVEGQMVTIFTTEAGTSYVEFLVTNDIPNDGVFLGNLGDLIEQEVLILPDETFGGLPVAHIYQRAMIQPDGPPMEIIGNKVLVYEGNDPSMPMDAAQPNLIIENVELVYYVSNPYYQVNDPNYGQRSSYIQPVWHFHGRFEDGTQFDVLIQALKQEFLLPELVPNVGMG